MTAPSPAPSSPAPSSPAGVEAATPWADIRWRTRDGLQLYARHYPAPHSRRAPVLCLPGLTRNSRDFHDIAMALSQGPEARNVYTMDMRGRGASDHDPDWKNYAIPIEMLDVQDFMAGYGLAGATILGTSRGGLIAMLLGAAAPTLAGAVILNDIGPVIEHAGLLRISSYVGKTPLPPTWEAATAAVARASSEHFPSVPEPQWAEIARQWFNEADGRPAPGYDAKLARTFVVKDAAVPPLWPQFLTLSHVPCLVIRGELSDLLSNETLTEMARRHPRCIAITVPGQGHAPLLKDRRTNAAISEFVSRVDRGAL